MKTRINVTIDDTVLKAAKHQNLILSNILETAIRQELSRIEKKSWEEENRQSINAYNTYISKKGVFSDNMRTF